MEALALAILWFALDLILLLGAAWILIYVVKLFIAIPGPVEQGIWLVLLILILIYAVTTIGGGGGGIIHGHFLR
jgi:hypothetical protein